jgi:signal transduction histidine kinase
MLELMNQYHHDIKAPLSIIEGVVSNDLYDDKKQQHVILEQVARGTKLITLMSSVLRGQRKRKTNPVDLKALIKSCTTLFERELNAVKFELDPLRLVIGDVDDLNILFINLIKNAVEAKVAQRKLIIVIKGYVTNSGVTIVVEDNGCGMSDSQLAEIWSLPNSNKLTGSGVGLRAVKRIADEHNVKVTVSSKVGHWTRFELCFALAEDLT